MSGQAGRWYFSRKEIEGSSPSRSDGIDLERETYLRRSYCTFLQDLGMRLKVPQVTIATAIVFCHRFFLRQSHAKNDRRTIATVCMFLAGKVEETPRPLRDVILISYEIINKKNPATIQKIKQKEVYERQKELILLGERVVLATLGFDLNVHHPYKILAEAIKKFKVAQNSLAQVAWNFVNDGLRTSLCLQCKPQHIAAGAIFLAAKFLKVKLPSNGEKVWWQEFDVTPHQLEEVSNQTLELYDQESSVKPGATKPSSTRPMSSVDNQSGSQKTQNRSNDNGSTETRTLMSEHKVDGETKDHQHSEVESLPCYRENSGETLSGPKLGLDQHVDEDQERNSGRPETMEAEGKKDGTTQKSGTTGTSGWNLDHREGPVSQHVDEDQERNSGRPETMEAEEGKKDGTTQKSGTTGTSGRNLDHREGPVSQSPQDAIRKIDRDKVKAALEKRRKSHGDIARKMDLMDEDDLIERELEDGIELAVKDEKIKHERRQSWSYLSNRQEPEDQESGKDHEDTVTGNQSTPKGQSPVGPEARDVERREASLFDNGEQEGLRSPMPIIRKRKAMSPDDLQSEGKRSNYSSGYLHYHQNSIEDGNRIGGQLGNIERDNKRQLQESRV